ncbi:hypothetical protein COL922a_012031, partial [Colletotrichum nupharicola]
PIPAKRLNIVILREEFNVYRTVNSVARYGLDCMTMSFELRIGPLRMFEGPMDVSKRSLALKMQN